MDLREIFDLVCVSATMFDCYLSDDGDTVYSRKEDVNLNLTDLDSEPKNKRLAIIAYRNAKVGKDYSEDEFYSLFKEALHDLHMDNLMSLGLVDLVVDDSGLIGYKFKGESKTNTAEGSPEICKGEQHSGETS